MAQKKNLKTVVPKPKRRAPKAKNQHIDQNVADVGLREVTRVIDGRPKTVETQEGPVITPGGFMRVKGVVAQPFLTEEEAIGLGQLVWHEYTGPVQLDENDKRPIVYTTVVNGRRFMVDARVFAELKEGKLATQNG